MIDRTDNWGDFYALLREDPLCAPEEQASFDKLMNDLKNLGFDEIQEITSGNRIYIGHVVGDSALHLAQDIGRREVIIHDKRDLDKLPKLGDYLTVSYRNCRGVVLIEEPGQNKSLSR